MLITRRDLLFAAALLPLVGCTGRPAASTDTADTLLQRSFFCFDTACSVGGVMDESLLDELVERCQGFEGTLSRTIPTSDVGMINAAGGVPVTVEQETADLMVQALHYCEASGGLFDITIGAVSSLWDFHEEVVPDPAQIEAALPHVDWRTVQVDGTTVTLGDPEAMLDLGGIAKGYVADVLCDMMGERGVVSGYVNLGGNVKVVGSKPDGSPWQVGVRDPDPDASSESSIARISLDGGSVVTSGLYERQFERAGQRYWHILDPRTGYPVRSSLTSATIVSERSIDGDGYTKPLFMMDADEIGSWAGEHAGLRLLLVGEDGTIRMLPEGSFELL